MSRLSLFCIFALLLSGHSVYAGPTIYKDWAVACDNTRHCDATGYQADDSDSEPVMLHLEREAGPNAPVTATFMTQTEDDSDTGTLTIQVGKTALRGIRFDHPLSTSQVNSLLPALLNADSVKLSNGKATWVLSLAGIKAALLKMDDLQGRVGTPGALVRKGAKPESSVLPALAPPVLHAAPLPPTRKDDDKLVKPILKSIKEKGDCDKELLEDDTMIDVSRLSSTQVLLTLECSRAAYQSGYKSWIANDKPPYLPRPVRFPAEDGAFDDYVMNAEFSEGVMMSYNKGRGLADCIATTSWLWTAAGFKLLDANIAPLCKGFAGGGVMLRTWHASVAH